ncbi:MAG: zinc ribbon domain-containing protein [Acidobacteriota bacterium]|nr:zinc ribbon domain-containing protein [Acidobacteriota bacterium]MDH3522410.1 zinc ribbon domain-containing protein [Acidobacteriota bacterium]
MAEVAALVKHSCPACGAQAEWNPGRQLLACTYCGTESPHEIDASGAVREIDLARTLREMPDELRGWQAEKTTVRCRSCDAVSVFDPSRVGQNCEFCGSPELVAYEEIKAPIRPQSLLPFKIGAAAIRDSLRRWFADRWFAPRRLRSKALVDTVHGAYIPYWTFDARVDCPWRAESGHYHYTTESYTDSGGRRRSRRVRHVSWRPAAGRLQHVFDDQPVPGTRGVAPDLLARVEPFPTQELVPYDTAYLSGFVVEHYRVVLIEAARQSREAMERRLRELCARQVPGDTHRNLEIDPRYSGETFKHILVPVWLLTYDYRGRSFQLVANGYTGKIAGRYPKSGWKILLLALAAAIVLVTFLVLAG